HRSAAARCLLRRPVRRGAAEDRRADHAERRIQRALRGAAWTGAAPRRPSLRMDARGIRGLGAGRGRALRLCRALRGHRRGRSGARAAYADGNLHMELRSPDFSLVVLIGASGSGKSSFAARHFTPTEVLSSDRCRGWVSDDETDQGATKDAFDILHFIAGKRLAARRLTVVDATNVRPEDRKLLVELAPRHHALPVTLVI